MYMNEHTRSNGFVRNLFVKRGLDETFVPTHAVHSVWLPARRIFYIRASVLQEVPNTGIEYVLMQGSSLFFP
jgi:hypothetical protein